MLSGAWQYSQVYLSFLPSFCKPSLLICNAARLWLDRVCTCLQAFFVRWWYEQRPELQQAVKQLVSSGRLEFINGGYVQHDEAAAHYVAMIDQTTRGHRRAFCDCQQPFSCQQKPSGSCAAVASHSGLNLSMC